VTYYLEDGSFREEKKKKERKEGEFIYDLGVRVRPLGKAQGGEKRPSWRNPDLTVTSPRLPRGRR